MGGRLNRGIFWHVQTLSLMALKTFFSIAVFLAFSYDRSLSYANSSSLSRLIQGILQADETEYARSCRPKKDPRDQGLQKPRIGEGEKSDRYSPNEFVRYGWIRGGSATLSTHHTSHALNFVVLSCGLDFSVFVAARKKMKRRSAA